MAAKRRATSSTKVGGKKFTSAKEALKATGPQVKGTRNPDIFCCLSNVHEDYDCVLNQTNMGNNNNKFYVNQILVSGGEYYCWTRWGRVGESGRINLAGPSTADIAIKSFEKKFEEKTKNNWSENNTSGKYTLIEVDGDQDAEVKVDTVDGGNVKVKSEQQVLPCTLDEATQRVIRFIFDNDMFKEAMTSMNLDIKKMPLGKLSKQQIAKGLEALEEIEAAIKKGERNKLEELANKFFTIIPHNFGRNRPPVISDDSVLQGKKEMLLVLADIEVAQSLKAESEKAKEEMKDMVPHPVDQNYQSLKCKLSLMDKKSKEFKIIEKYLNTTGRKGLFWCMSGKLREIQRENYALENRKLLWHGTNVAVVAAILKSALCPILVDVWALFLSLKLFFFLFVFSVHPSNNTGIMFLNEVALGKEYTITQDCPSLRKAPAGYDSVVTRGSHEPDPSKDVFIEFDGKKVAVPQGKAIKQQQYQGSSFFNSEYLVYEESQCCIRYLLELKFGY
uniref:Poly [ADP-ribose] polymerase n=1 Tax=Sinocyclocheilus grahami TaxID=75366 RepID=A0A672NLQ5_SINGR